ncbi:hypothetical protein [Streptomyces sp. NPDC007100]|uniref:hypothetical protein n=1 Tax=Streptomyces sp. NPDC007100 TaxID=3155602 RepID=UPI0033F36D42
MKLDSLQLRPAIDQMGKRHTWELYRAENSEAMAPPAEPGDDTGHGAVVDRRRVEVEQRLLRDVRGEIADGLGLDSLGGLCRLLRFLHGNLGPR